MAALLEQPVRYKVAVFVLLKSTALFITGFIAPWWAQSYNHDKGVVGAHTGLWMGCADDGCSAISGQPDWFKAVQGFQSIGLVGMIISCVYAAYIALCREKHKHTRIVEIMAGAGGLLGFTGCMMYIANTSPILKHSPEVSYSWALGLDLAASVLVSIVALVIAFSNPNNSSKGNDRRFFYYYDHRRSRGRLTDDVAEGNVEESGGDVVCGHSDPAARSRRGMRGPEVSTEVYVLQASCPTHVLSSGSPGTGRTRRNACSSSSEAVLHSTSLDPTSREEARATAGVALPTYAHALQEGAGATAAPPPYTPPLEGAACERRHCACSGWQRGAEGLALDPDVLRQRSNGSAGQSQVASRRPRDTGHQEHRLQHEHAASPEASPSVVLQHRNVLPQSCTHLNPAHPFLDLGRFLPSCDFHASAPPPEECSSHSVDTAPLTQ